MQRYDMVIQVRPEKFEEYKRLHGEVWPGIHKTIHDCNIRNYTIFHKDNYLFSYFEYVGQEFTYDMDRMAADPLTQEWWAVCKPCQLPLSTREDGEW